jgi:hypothetical protein
MFHGVISRRRGAADLGISRANSQRERRESSITIPQSELLLHGNHASLTICGFIHSRRWSMIDIIQSGKR